MRYRRSDELASISISASASASACKSQTKASRARNFNRATRPRCARVRLRLFAGAVGKICQQSAGCDLLLPRTAIRVGHSSKLDARAQQVQRILHLLRLHWLGLACIGLAWPAEAQIPQPFECAFAFALDLGLARANKTGSGQQQIVSQWKFRCSSAFAEPSTGQLELMACFNGGSSVQLALLKAKLQFDSKARKARKARRDRRDRKARKARKAQVRPKRVSNLNICPIAAVPSVLLQMQITRIITGAHFGGSILLVCVNYGSSEPTKTQSRSEQ